MGKLERGGPYSSRGFYHLKPTFSGWACRWMCYYDNVQPYTSSSSFFILFLNFEMGSFAVLPLISSLILIEALSISYLYDE
jgi:hypothetical protein